MQNYELEERRAAERYAAQQRAANEREELLHQRFKPNETHLNFEDSELYIHDKMKQSHSAVDDLLAQGTAVLGNLRSQGASLHGARRKVLEVTQTLGISGTTLRMIERRVGEDWLIFCVGCVFVLIFMFCFYRWWLY